MKKNSKSAFSLIELSVVLVIIAIITAGMLSASTVSINNARIKTTNERIKSIYNSLGNYMLLNYKLPCPASLNIARGSAGYGDAVVSGGVAPCAAAGIYKSSTQPSIIYGAVPTNALNLPKEMAEDGFGSKLIYIVNANATVAEYPNTPFGGFSTFAEDATSIRIFEVASGNVINGNAFVILSLGANKYGAFNATTTTQNTTTSTDTYEQLNYLTNIDTSVVPYTATFGSGDLAGMEIVSSNPASDIFDDIVFFKTRSQMVIDFDAMFLIPCAAITDYGLAYYGQTSYRATPCTVPNTVTPSKKCVAFGSWNDQQRCFTY